MPLFWGPLPVGRNESASRTGEQRSDGFRDHRLAPTARGRRRARASHASRRGDCVRDVCRALHTGSLSVRPEASEPGSGAHPGDRPDDPLQGHAYIVPRARKPAALAQVLELESPTSAIVFCRTRFEVWMPWPRPSPPGSLGRTSPRRTGPTPARPRDEALSIGKGRAPRGDGRGGARTGHRAPFSRRQLRRSLGSRGVPSPNRAHRPGRAEGIAITLAEPREHRLLRNIEAFTKQKIEIATLPTVADLRTRRLNLTRASLRERLLAGGLDGVRTVVQSLAEEFDLMDVAAAAIDLLHDRRSDPVAALFPVDERERARTRDSDRPPRAHPGRRSQPFKGLPEGP